MAAAGGAGYEAAQERGVNGTFDDMHIQAQISNTLNNQYGMVNTTVYGGQVLLTGSSPNRRPSSRPSRSLAQTARASRAIYNEIQVGPNEDGMQIAKDDWITARVRSDLVFNADVRSGNYTIETDPARSICWARRARQAELDRATQLARYVPGVQRVVSYVQVRYGEPNGRRPGHRAGGDRRHGLWRRRNEPVIVPPSGPPPSNAPIQVQKLN